MSVTTWLALFPSAYVSQIPTSEEVLEDTICCMYRHYDPLVCSVEYVILKKRGVDIDV